MISGSEGNITYVESMSTAVSAIIAGVAAILTAVAVVTVVVCTFGTGIFAVGAGAAMGLAAGTGAAAGTSGAAVLAVGAGTAVGAALIFGGIASKIITSNQYNLQFNRIATAVEVIGACAIVGLIVAATVYAAYTSKGPVEVKDPVEGNPVEGNPVEVKNPVEGNPVEVKDPVGGNPVRNVPVKESIDQYPNTVKDEIYNEHKFKFKTDNVALTSNDKKAVMIQASKDVNIKLKVSFKNIEVISVEKICVGGQYRIAYTIFTDLGPQYFGML